MTKAKAKSEIATQADGALMNPEDPGLPVPVEELAGLGTGLEESTSQHMPVPYLSIVQAMSKVHVASHPNYTEGAVNGQLRHGVTGQLLSGEDGIVIIPCWFKPGWIESKPQNKMPPFIQDLRFGEIGKDDLLPRQPGEEFQRHPVDPHNRIDEVNRMFCLWLRDGGLEPEPIVLTFRSSGLKYCRKWNGMLSARKVLVGGKYLPRQIFTASWLLTTFDDVSLAGEHFFSFKFTPNVQTMSAEEFEIAKALATAVSGGMVMVAPGEFEDATEAIDVPVTRP